MELQKIPLNKIQGLSERVRKSMSPELLEELEASLREVGQLVPVKVRAYNGAYVLVYGHRRVQAAKAAGMTEVDALVVTGEDGDLLTQSLIENVVRENMAAIDVANALQAIIETTGCTQEVLARKLGHAQSWVGAYLNMLDPELGNISRDITEYAVREAKAGTGGDLKLAGQVLQKAAKDKLSARDTRMVAEVARRAQDLGGPKAVTALLKQDKDSILNAHAVLPARRPDKKAKAPGRVVKTHFSWLKDPQSMLAEEGLKAASALVASIAKSEEDRGGGRVVLKNLLHLSKKLTVQIEKALDE